MQEAQKIVARNKRIRAIIGLACALTTLLIIAYLTLRFIREI